MPIKLKNIKNLNDYQINEIVEYYNQYRAEGMQPIYAHRENGFIIEIVGYDPRLPKNQRYRMLKWHNKILTSYIDYPGFYPEEEELLFIACLYVLGFDNVEKFASYSDALKSSPHFLKEQMIYLQNCT